MGESSKTEAINARSTTCAEGPYARSLLPMHHGEHVFNSLVSTFREEPGDRGLRRGNRQP